LKHKYTDRPDDMKPLDFLHKKIGKTFGFRKEESCQDKFNKTVKEMRILLNKLSSKNYEKVKNDLVYEIYFTPSLLYELMKIIFMRATTENTFLEIYVDLCVELFKKFNDKDNHEMNFKKLLLSKCQKQFMKMMLKEEQERASRKASINAE